MAPLGVAGPLILFRKNGRVLHQWFGVVSPDEEEHSARPPLQLLPALLVPCVALLVLVHPLVRVTVLRWPVFADGTVPSLRHAPARCGCLRTPFDALDAILCSSFIIFAASCYYENMAVPLRIAGAALALVTPWTAAGAARIGAFSGSTDAVWRRATSKFVAPGLVLGLVGLRLGKRSTWFGPLSPEFVLVPRRSPLALAAASLTVERADDATRVSGERRPSPPSACCRGGFVSSAKLICSRRRYGERSSRPCRPYWRGYEPLETRRRRPDVSTCSGRCRICCSWPSGATSASF